MYKQIINYIFIIVISIQLVACGNSKSDFEIHSTQDSSNLNQNSQELDKEINKEEIELVENLAVYICGAVHKPGVYEFNLGARLNELIQKAGGLKEEAHQEYLNQAQLLIDGEKIYVPTVKEVEEGGVISILGEKVEDDGKVNINTASVQELMSLTGVGEAKAISIITYREEKGAFTTIEDVMKISGIKDAVFNTIKEQIKV